MPFDIENAVKWNANYLKGYSSEKRDINIEQVKTLVEAQSKDIARFAANDTQSVCSDSPYKNSTLSRKKEGVLFFAFCYKAANTEEISSCSTKSAILS